MFKCCNCGHEHTSYFKFCPVCGAVQPVQPQPSYTAQPMQPQPTQPKKKKTRIGCIVAPIIAVLLIAAIVLGIIFIPNPLTEMFKKLTPEEMEQQSTLIDYSVIIETVKSCRTDVTAYICDADGDGTDELFINTDYEAAAAKGKKIDYYRLTYAFDPNYSYSADGNHAEKCHIVGASTPYRTIGSGGADVTKGDIGEASVMLSDKHGVVLERGVKNGETAYYKWTNGGWEYIMSNTDDVASLGIKPLNNSSYNYGSVYFEGRNLNEFYSYYLNRGTVNGYFRGQAESDYDYDGKTEYVNVYNGFCDSWTEKASYETVGEDYALTACKNEDFSAAVFFDFGRKAALVHIVSLTGGVNQSNFSDFVINYTSGLMHISYVAAPTSEHSGGYMDRYAALARVEEYREFYDFGNKSDYEIAAKLRAAQLNGMYYGGNSDVRYRMCDISSANGVEMITAALIGNSDSYRFEAWTFYKGRVMPIFSDSYSTSLGGYLTGFDTYYIYPDGGKSKFLCYSQIYDNYLIRYAYGILGFDSNFNATLEKSEALEVDLNSDKASESKFFDNFNSFLRSSTICVDPYFLKGYSVMTSESSADSSNSQFNVDLDNGYDKYLEISNCNTSKSGVVKISSQWLNLREGPSTDYSRVYIDPTDKKSYIKQYKGSTVTVLDTVNTGNKKNPIWVLIQTTYGGTVFQGYSSQKYIELEAKHISVGESFDIDADTNDTGLYWTVNDTSVATIDATNGKIIGKKAGLVMVTVTSSSGLSDTCLIAIDK